jgi:hypothetical protein
MKQFFINFFVALGVIFLILIVIGIYFFVTDPYELKPLIFGTSGSALELPASTSTESDETGQNGTDEEDTSPSATSATAQGGFTLSTAQQQALIGLGIEPSSVPTSISAEQEACFTAALGEARVLEIKAGDVPNAMEFLKAKACI